MLRADTERKQQQILQMVINKRDGSNRFYGCQQNSPQCDLNIGNIKKIIQVHMIKYVEIVLIEDRKCDNEV